MPNTSTQHQLGAHQRASYRAYIIDDQSCEAETGNNRHKAAIFSSLVKAPACYSKIWFAHNPAKLTTILHSMLPYVNLNTRNTWEFPHNKGLAAHETMIEAYAISLETYMQNITGNKLTANQIAKMRWRRQVYAAFHDSGKAWKGFAPVDGIPDTLTDAEKISLSTVQEKIAHLNAKFKDNGIESVMTQLFMLKSIFKHDLADIDDLLQEVADLLECKIKEDGSFNGYFGSNNSELNILKAKIDGYTNNCIIDYMNEVVDVDFSNVPEHIAMRMQQITLFTDLNVFIKDTVGGYIQQYCKTGNDADKQQDVISEFHDAMRHEYTDMSNDYKQENSLEVFVQEKLSNFLADIAYYPNLHLVYFDKNNLPLPQFDAVLRSFANMQKSTHLSALNMPIVPIQPAYPIAPRAWSTPYSPFYIEAKLYAQNNIAALGLFVNAKSLQGMQTELDTSANNESDIVGYRIEYAAGNNTENAGNSSSVSSNTEPKKILLTEIIETQVHNLKLALDTPKTKAIMASHVDNVIFNS